MHCSVRHPFTAALFSHCNAFICSIFRTPLRLRGSKDQGDNANSSRHYEFILKGIYYIAIKP